MMLHSASRAACFGRSFALGLLLALVSLASARAQTPSPFAYWQNAAGIVLAPLGGPLPQWRITLGAGAAALPLYEGSDHYKVTPAPAFDIRYKDIAFLSSGDGLGVNIVRGTTYRAGVAVSYDIGRNPHLSGRLNGLGNIDAAPEAKLFGEATLLPFVFSVDVRHAIGGTNGIIGDVGVYMPVAGTEQFAVFVGPSATFANTRYMNAYFGVSTTQAQGSSAHFPVYRASGGLKSLGFGATAIYRFTGRWLLDADIGFERLDASPGNSPIVQDREQLGGSVILAYQF